MKSIKLILPQRFSLGDVVDFCNIISNLEETDRLVLNFKEMKYTPPFAMLFLSTTIGQYKKDHPEVKIIGKNYQHLDYAGHMGFFKLVGVEFGKEPGEAAGSETYLPITSLSVQELKKEAAKNMQHPGELIEKHANRISQILTQQDKGDLVDTLTYSIREICRNVIEHSNSEVLSYCAQYWSSKHRVEVAIIDTGIGIRSTLSANPHLKITNDKDALNLSLMPGISGKMFKGIKDNTNDEWKNSGYGLYMTNRLCRNGGSFFICSGDSGLELKEKSKKYFNTLFCGTAIRLGFDTRRIETISKALEKYNKEGIKIAKRLKGLTNIGASTASRMLLTDFD